MYTAVLTIHVLLAVVLIILVLLQQGKGADAGAVMGGGGANTVFGVGGASSLLVRMTTFIAVLFMLTSVGLVKLALSDGSQGGNRVDALSGSLLGTGSDASTKDQASPPAGQGAVKLDAQGDAQKTEQKPAEQAPVPANAAPAAK